MIDNRIETITHTNAPIQDFSIAMNASMFQMLTKNVYTNVIAAVIREWSTNAIDACIAAGVSPRFDVHLPTIASQVFSVRDFGTGLSSDDVHGLFSALGASTKRESNQYNGTFGIGRMAGLAYTDMFTIESFFNGTLSTYVVSIQDGIPNMISINDTDTDLPNGMRLSIDVREYDIDRFTSEARDIYQYFDTRPDTNIQLEYQDYSSNLSGDGWYIINTNVRNYNLNLVMGNVLYTVSTSQLNKEARDVLEIHGLVLDVPIGSVSITPGRESLNLDNTTITYLNNSCKHVIDQYEEQLTNLICSFDKDFDKIIAYSKYITRLGWNLQNRFKNISIDYSTLYVKNNCLRSINMEVGVYYFKNGFKNIKSVNEYIHITNSTIFCIADTRIHIVESIKKYLLETNNNFVDVYIVKPNRWSSDPEDIKSHVQSSIELFDEIGIKNYFKTSDYSVENIQRKKSGKISTIDFMFENKYDTEPISKKGVEILSIDTGPFYYIETSGFKPISMTPDELSLHMRAAKFYDNINSTNTRIVGVPKSALRNTVDDDRFIPLAGALDDIFSEMTMPKYFNDIGHENSFILYDNRIHRYTNLNLPDELIEFITEHKKFFEQNRQCILPANAVGIKDRFGCNVSSPNSKLSLEDVMEKYPLFMYILDTFYRDGLYLSMEQIENYVQTIYEAGDEDEQNDQ